jgi:hypothetical protein
MIERFTQYPSPNFLLESGGIQNGRLNYVKCFIHAIMASAVHQIVLQTSDIIHKVNATIQQAQNNRLSTELLRGKR